MPSQNWLPQLLELQSPDSQTLKKALSLQGINARGWRLYADFGDSIFAPLGQLTQPGPQRQMQLQQALGLLKLLAACEMDMLPPPVLLCSIGQWQIPGRDFSLVPPGLLRAVWKACVAIQHEVPEQPQAVNEWIRAELLPCMRWYFQNRLHQEAEASWRNAPWHTVKRRWRQAMHAQLTSGQPAAMMPLAGAEWPVFVARVRYQGVVFQALHNTEVLRQEGQQLSHCVGSYAPLCRHSLLRIYAITEERTGQRLGTLSVDEKQPGCWVIDGLHGPCNFEVSALVQEAAIAVVCSLEEAYHRNAQLRQQMQQCRQLKRTEDVLGWG